jgi:signal peptidase I
MIRWLFSKTIRDTCGYRKHVERLMNAQRDLLSPQAIAGVQVKIDELNAAIAEKASLGKIRIKAEELQFAAEKWLKPYPNAVWRENVEVLLVALAVAMAIRTFFVQPFKIPTGSMQPTLYGVTSTNLIADKTFQIPTGLERVKEWFEGATYVHVVAQSDGVIKQISPMRKFLIFNIKQSLWIGSTNDASPGVEHTIWFPPDYGESPVRGMDPFLSRAQLRPGHFYHKGDDVIKICVRAGDHLFVDRLSYNFRKPARGDIIVFETAGIQEDMRHLYGIPPDEFYIKRLVALPDEKVSIGDDRHLRINGQRLDASTPHFENVYGFDPDKPPHDSEYSGHVNGTVAQEYNLNTGVLPLFPDAETAYDVPANSFMPMGDNTCSSLDSRFFGAVPEYYAIGKSFLVYWPLTGRFGWSNR